MEGRLSFIRHIQADHPRLSCRQIRFHLFFAQSQTVFVIYDNIRPVLRNRRAERIQSCFVTETIVGIALLHQLFCIFQIDAGGLAFTLDIRAVSPVLIRSLVMDEAGLLKRPVYDIHSAFHIALLIRILDTEDKIPALMLRDQVRIKRCP